jgi:tRNA-dihydrouridine synthase A
MIEYREISTSRDRSEHRFATAPMMNLSDCHCHYLWRLITKRARLYTEMVTTGALLYGARGRFLQRNASGNRVALQLGGSNPKELAACAKMAAQFGYDEINLNCGCPSNRVQNNMIGACLMAHPHLVANCIKAMQDAVDIKVTIKHRTGIDTTDNYQALVDFVGTVAATGCTTFIIHARKAWLQGLSPKENREKPPLQYEKVYRLKKAFPQLTIVINGGITTMEDCQLHLQYVDGVMMGREAYHNPFSLVSVDASLFGHNAPPTSRRAVALSYIDYCEQQLTNGVRLHHLSRHLLGLYQGTKGARRFRRFISDNVHRSNADVGIIYRALEYVADNQM